MEAFILVFVICAVLVGVYFFWDWLDRRNACKRWERSVVASGLVRPEKGVTGAPVQPVAVSELVQPVKVRSGWQVQFAGEWHECSPPLGENSPGWVRVRLTDRRTHSRVIVRPTDEIQQVQ